MIKLYTDKDQERSKIGSLHEFYTTQFLLVKYPEPSCNHML